MNSDTPAVALSGSYAIRLLLVYAFALAGALLWLFVAFIVVYTNQWVAIVVFLVPVVAGPLVFAVALTRSPWLRDAVVLRVLMIVTGTVALSGLYVMMYAAYGQGIGVYAPLCAGVPAEPVLRLDVPNRTLDPAVA